MIIADLQIHSRYARACSSQINIDNLVNSENLIISNPVSLGELIFDNSNEIVKPKVYYTPLCAYRKHDENYFRDEYKEGYEYGKSDAEFGTQFCQLMYPKMPFAKGYFEGYKYHQYSPISKSCDMCGRWLSSGVFNSGTGYNSYVTPQYLKPVVKSRSKILNLV